MIPPSPNAVSLENRRGKMTSLRGRPVGLSGLKLSVRLDFTDKNFARPGCGMIFLPSIKGRGQQLAWLIAMRKRFSLASHAVGLLYSYNCVTNRSLSVETNFPSRSLDCLMHNFIGVNLSITDLIAEALVKVPRQDRFWPALIRIVDFNDT